jgi:hypothetical protein
VGLITWGRGSHDYLPDVFLFPIQFCQLSGLVKNLATNKMAQKLLLLKKNLNKKPLLYYCLLPYVT